ncbi:MAG TPA: NAD(P)-dependent alcohol dehydrogenase [Polyangiaceae bacterium]|nr:NAD(P)-dependent alcohol dehydrogenase [Polyangiaceae bacterium]
MKAVVYHRYGSPDALSLVELPTPIPRAHEVLVRVHAAAVNPADWRLLRADPFLVRVMGRGFFAPKKPVLGADLAGVVVAVGAEVTAFHPGDEVFGGSLESGSGAFAEYVTVPETSLVAKPVGLDFEQAAAIPLAALTALLALRDRGELEAGQRVLIQGASGGVGSFAVQLARHLGAHVTAVTSTRNLELVGRLGADRVIDYTTEDWTLDERHRFDLILGVAGYHPLSAYARCLEDGGTYVCVGGRNAQLFEAMLLGPLYSLFSNKRFCILSESPGPQHLDVIRAWAAEGRLVPLIDRRYELSGVPDAIRYIEAGHARGKVVIRVAA